MRQFVFGLLVAGLVWWGYQSWSVQAAGTGAADAGAPSTPPPAANLDALLPPTNKPGQEAALAAPANAAAKGDAPADLPADLLTRVAANDREARALAWGAVATGRAGGQRSAFVQALQPKARDWETAFSALGNDNSFLHSVEGRQAAEVATAAAMAFNDPEALTAGSQLLALMLRGRIELPDTAARALVDACYQQHRIRVDRWLCNPTNVAAARTYEVQSGDSLARIASRFRKEGLLVEAGTLAVLNRIHNPNALQVGQKLKVPVQPMLAVLEKRSFGLALYVGEHLLRLYWVGHGEHDRTPVTEFTVTEKQPRPQWTAPDGNVYAYGHPKNILGEYFIKFQHPQYTGFGAHGTPMPETIGTMSSMGCIRMKDGDIAELFEVLPRGSKVVVLANESLR
jgi:nucleoid-associated protein YgaU